MSQHCEAVVATSSSLPSPCISSFRLHSRLVEQKVFSTVSLHDFNSLLLVTSTQCETGTSRPARPLNCMKASIDSMCVCNVWQNSILQPDRTEIDF